MIDVPDWMVLTFAIIGLWFVVSLLFLIAIMILGRIFDLHLSKWRQHKIRRDQRRLVRGAETLLHKQPTGQHND